MSLLQTWINWNANAFLYMSSSSAGELAGTPLHIGRVVQDLAGYVSQYALESSSAQDLATAAQTSKTTTARPKSTSSVAP